MKILRASMKLISLKTHRVINNADIIPHGPPEDDGYHHTAQHVWFHPNGMQQYTLCTAESPQCSDSIPDYKLSPSDHHIAHYLKLNPQATLVKA